MFIHIHLLLLHVSALVGHPQAEMQLIDGSYCTYNGFIVLCALCIIKLQFLIYLANPAVVS
jgi:hypothetical protein